MAKRPIPSPAPLPQPPLSDEALAALLHQGDADALRLVTQRHNRRLYRVARAILKDDAEAEDALQEAYVRALTHTGAFRGQASLSTWLTRIVINEALGRRRARRPSVQLAAVEGVSVRADDTAGAVDLQRLDDGPEHEAARAELRGLIERAVENLPEAFRLVFVLRAVEGLSVAETAAHVGVPEATIKTRFHRARRLLRQMLDGTVEDVLRDAFPFAGPRCDRMTESVLARVAASPNGIASTRRTRRFRTWAALERVLARWHAR